MAEKTSLFDRETEKIVQISIGITQSMKDLIKNRAMKHNLSSSYYCRKLFEIYFENEEVIEALAEGKVKVVPVDIVK